MWDAGGALVPHGWGPLVISFSSSRPDEAALQEAKVSPHHPFSVLARATRYLQAPAGTAGLVPAMEWLGPLASWLLKLSSAPPHPPSAEHSVGGDAADVLLSPLLQCAKDEPESRKYWSAPLHRAARPRLQPTPRQHDGNGEFRRVRGSVASPSAGMLADGSAGTSLSGRFGSKPGPERAGMGTAGMGQEGSLALTQPEGMARLLAAPGQVMGLKVPWGQWLRSVPGSSRGCAALQGM